MKGKVCLITVVSILLLVTSPIASAAVVPISVYPDPVQFGAVPENSSSFPLLVEISNTTSHAVVVSGMSISGTNSSNFAFEGPNCVGTISGGQTCQMGMTFTPPTMGSFSANLAISVQGLSQAINIPLEGTGGNPIPTITSLSPPSAYVNSPALTLTVNGTGFVPGAVFRWQNSALPTTYVSATELEVQVPAANLTGTGSYFVNVSNPPPGGGFSGSANFAVVGLDPSLSSASPNSLVAGSKSATVTVTGNNFMNGANVLWNGKALPTTYINSGELEIEPSTADLATPNIVQLSVSNPPPGGVSFPITFNVTYPAKVTILDLPANDLVWDPYAQRIYASLPSSYGSNGNSIAVINPYKGRISGYYFAGSEPNQLALSSDSQYLYVGLNGNGSVQRLLLPTFAQDIDVSLGSSFIGVNVAVSLQVSPGDSHTFAVAQGTSQGSSTGLFVFTDSTQLPNSITSPPMADIVFADPATLYGYYNGTVSQIAVDSSGATLGMQWNGLVSGNAIQYAAGLVYGSGGQVLDPAAGLLVGSYDVSQGCCSPNELLPDPAVYRVFVVGETPFFPGALGVTSYHLSKFTPAAVTNLSQLSGSPIGGFIKWGNSGLAFILQSGCCGTTTNQVILVQSASMLFGPVGTTNPMPDPQSLSPSGTTHGGPNFPLIIEGAGFVPGSRVTWNGVAVAADYVSPAQLTAYVPARDIASSGTADVVVTNPDPGGGMATALSFTIN